MFFKDKKRNIDSPLLIRIRVYGKAEPLVVGQKPPNEKFDLKKSPHPITSTCQKLRKKSLQKINTQLNRLQLSLIILFTGVLSFVLGSLWRPFKSLADVSPVSPEHIVYIFFLSTLTIFLIGGIVLSAVFIVSAIQGKREQSMDGRDKEYDSFYRKSGILRICYGANVFADILLSLIEVISTAIGAYIVLFDDVNTSLVAVMLIIVFLSSSIRSALNLKYNRIAYAKAFRELEFALDDYLSSDKTSEDIEKLHLANRKAQAHIEYFNE